MTEEHGVTALPFLVRDQSGTVGVVLDTDTGVPGAETNDIEHLSLDFLRPYARVTKDTGTWRAKEQRVKVGDRVFLTAHARLTPEGDQRSNLVSQLRAVVGAAFEHETSLLEAAVSTTTRCSGWPTGSVSSPIRRSPVWRGRRPFPTSVTSSWGDR